MENPNKLCLTNFSTKPENVVETKFSSSSGKLDLSSFLNSELPKKPLCFLSKGGLLSKKDIPQKLDFMISCLTHLHYPERNTNKKLYNFLYIKSESPDASFLDESHYIIDIGDNKYTSISFSCHHDIKNFQVIEKEDLTKTILSNFPDIEKIKRINLHHGDTLLMTHLFF